MPVDAERGEVAETAEVASQTPAATQNLLSLSARRHGAFALLLVGAVALHLYHLAHSFIAPWDEAFHAVVAEHLMLHPLQPTLYETGALHVPESGNWNYTHIWLHVPPFGLWASALSMRILGQTPLALRLPGVMFVAVGMIATYLLGRRLFGSSTVGLVGAAFVGYAPYLLLLGQGYVFGDMTDTPLLALMPLAVLALVVGYQTGRLRWIVLAGLFQGLGYLSKGGLALAPLGVAMALYTAEWVFRQESGWRRLGLRGLLTFAGVAVLTAGPYTLYTALTFPAAYQETSREWTLGFFTNFEGWGRPPDYHLTVYLFALYGTAHALILVSAVAALGVVGMLRHSRADMIPVVWVLTLYLPLTIAVSKAVPMTIGAVPALGLAAGRLLTLTLGSHRLRWRAVGLGLLCSAAVAAVIIGLGWLGPALLDFDPSRAVPQQFSQIATQQRVLPYLLEIGLAVVCTLVCGALLWLAHARRGEVRFVEITRHRSSTSNAQLPESEASQATLGRWNRVIIVLAVLAVLILGAYWLSYDLRVVARVPDDPGPVPAVGIFLKQHTPANTTVLLDSALESQESQAHEHITLMFWAQRDVYPVGSVQSATICPLVQEARQSNSPVVLITAGAYTGQLVESIDGWTIYRPDCSGAS